MSQEKDLNLTITKNSNNSKRSFRIHPALRIVIFIVLAALLIRTVYGVFRWKDTSGNYISSMDQLYATAPDRIDVVYTGSSHCYAGVYPAVAWIERGIASFDMAVSGQDKWSSYHDLVEVLKTQHPKVVFADLYGLTFEEHGVKSNEYRNMLAMRTSRNSIGLIRDYADRDDWMDYILRWPVVHTRYRELDAFDFTENPLNEFGRGGLYDWDYTPVTNTYSQVTDITPLSDNNRRWLNRMNDLSSQYGFRLVYMILPYAMGDEDRMVYNGVKEYLASQTDLIDFTDPAVYASVGLDESTDFHDGGHLSGFGAVKVTQYLERYLDGKGLLASSGHEIAQTSDRADNLTDLPTNYTADSSTANNDIAEDNIADASTANDAASTQSEINDLLIQDHRGDPAYSQWDQDYSYYNQTKYTWVLPRTGNALSYCALLANTTDLTAVISLEGDYAAESERDGTSPVPAPGEINPDDDYTGIYDGYYAALSLLGMSHEDYLSGGKWLYRDGELQKIHENDPDEEPYSMDLSKIDSLRVQYNGDFVQGNVMINMRDASNADGCPLHIIVYDTLVDQLVDGKSF